MKNLVVILLSLIFYSQNTFAQRAKFEAGLEGGAGITSLWGNELVSRYNDPTTGFCFGAAFQYNFPRILSIRTNLFFDRKGNYSKGTVKSVTGDNLDDFRVHSNFSYLTVPILLRATFGKKINYFFNAGPYAGYLVKQTSKYKIGEQKTNFDNTDYFKRIDFGITTGAGICFPLTSSLALSFEIRNNLGLYNLSKYPVYGNGTLNTHSTNLLIGIAYKFGVRNETAAK